MSWEETFQSWASAPSQTEQDKCDNAVRMIRKAIDAWNPLKSMTITIFPQGSYRNRTNVRQDSDVDICMLCTDYVFTDHSFSEGLTDTVVGISPASYSYREFKDEVGRALIDYFGDGGIQRGNKAFDIHENTYRMSADAVPCFEHRRYIRNGTGGYRYLSGTQFFSDSNDKIINWPDQNYDNGVSKNNDTNRQFKSVVRILKHLRNKMAEENIAAATPIPSYLIECLAWNVPNINFDKTTHFSMIRSVLAHLFNMTINEPDCNEWGEINELKYLFKGSHKWTLQQTHDFLSAAWDYIGYSN